MKLSEQVITVQQAKRLFELGINCEEPAYHWIFDCGMKWDLHPIGYYYLEEEGIEYFPAYTVAELGVMLRLMKRNNLLPRPVENNMWVIPNTYEWTEGYEKSEAQARGKLLIYLLETGIITAEQCNLALAA